MDFHLASFTEEFRQFIVVTGNNEPWTGVKTSEARATSTDVLIPAENEDRLIHSQTDRSSVDSQTERITNRLTDLQLD